MKYKRQDKLVRVIDKIGGLQHFWHLGFLIIALVMLIGGLANLFIL